MANVYTQSNGVHTWTALTVSENGESVLLNDGAGLACAVQCSVGGGTGFNSGTVTCQVSNDDTNWITAVNLQGVDVTFTAAGLSEISTGARYIRVIADSSIGDVDASISIL